METTQFHIAQMGLFWGQYFYLLKVVPQNIDAHEKLSWGRKSGLIRPLGTKEFKCFYFWYIDSVTYFVGIARKNGQYDDSLIKATCWFSKPISRLSL